MQPVRLIASPWKPTSQMTRGWGGQPHPGQDRAFPRSQRGRSLLPRGPADSEKQGLWAAHSCAPPRATRIPKASRGLRQEFWGCPSGPHGDLPGLGVLGTGRPRCRARPLTARRPSPARTQPGAQDPWARPGGRGCRATRGPTGLARPPPWVTIKRCPQGRAAAASNQPGASSAVRHAGPPLQRAPPRDWLSGYPL